MLVFRVLSAGSLLRTALEQRVLFLGSSVNLETSSDSQRHFFAPMSFLRILYCKSKWAFDVLGVQVGNVTICSSRSAGFPASATKVGSVAQDFCDDRDVVGGWSPSCSACGSYLGSIYCHECAGAQFLAAEGESSSMIHSWEFAIDCLVGIHPLSGVLSSSSAG